jgi:hypothetical protein
MASPSLIVLIVAGRPRPVAEALQPPGGACAGQLGQPRRVRALVVGDHEIERPGVRWTVLADDVEHGADVLAGERRAVADREDAVVAGGAAQRGAVGPHAAQPHRGARPLHRRRAHLRAVEVERRAVVGDRLARPQRHEQLERLVEQARPGAPVGLLAEGGDLTPAVAAEAGAEDHAPARQAVEHRDLAGDLPRTPARQRRHHRPEAHALGGQGDGSQRDPRVGDVERVVRHDVVPEEHAVPAGLLGARADVGQGAHVGELAERRHVQAAAHQAAAATG